MVKGGIELERKNQTYDLISEIPLKQNQCGLLEQRLDKREVEEVVSPSSKDCKCSSFVLINIHTCLDCFFQIYVCST
jgi:hypothetical protein